MAGDDPRLAELDARLQRAYLVAVREYRRLFPGRPEPYITSAYRSAARQDELYRDGVTPVRGGNSNHQRGGPRNAHAFDVGFRDASGRYQWNPRYFSDFASVMSSVDAGIVWGGTWRTRDLVHFEIPRSGRAPRGATVSLPLSPVAPMSPAVIRFLLLAIATVLAIYATRAMST